VWLQHTRTSAAAHTQHTSTHASTARHATARHASNNGGCSAGNTNASFLDPPKPLPHCGAPHAPARRTRRLLLLSPRCAWHGASRGLLAHHCPSLPITRVSSHRSRDDTSPRGHSGHTGPAAQQHHGTRTRRALPTADGWPWSKRLASHHSTRWDRRLTLRGQQWIIGRTSGAMASQARRSYLQASPASARRAQRLPVGCSANIKLCNVASCHANSQYEVTPGLHASRAARNVTRISHTAGRLTGLGCGGRVCGSGLGALPCMFRCTCAVAPPQVPPASTRLCAKKKQCALAGRLRACAGGVACARCAGPRPKGGQQGGWPVWACGQAATQAGSQAGSQAWLACRAAAVVTPS
jgi:hypothetical protein